ncbi:VOC family protein [Streptomyces sp. B1866]|uniref:VOC family protein n=1 Tax=Streptomyces sp. B1866 TaxID=3075431 RepID=UPI00288DA166|nr:VOC family protein [Streptomyces sp. B1866]MDT3396918.1 VOC family protein [Streptomyces sp. B1866]
MATRRTVTVGLALDCADPTRLAEFWKLALGYEDEPPPAPFTTREEWLARFGLSDDDQEDAAWLHDPTGANPRLFLQQVREPKLVKNRLHLDLRVSGQGSPAIRWARVRQEADRLEAAGATVVAEYSGHHVVMADPEGHEFCVC